MKQYVSKSFPYYTLDVTQYRYNYFAHVSSSQAQANGKFYINVKPTNDATGYKDAGVMEFAPNSVVDEGNTIGNI